MVESLNHKMMEIKVHDHDYRINYVWNLMKKELSEKNVKLIQRYDEHMTSLALAKATRSKNLQTILNLSRMIKKDWVDLTKEDADSLVAKIMTRYGSDSGQETNSSWDHKKILKIFFRWVRLGSRDHSEVGDPPETKGIKLKKVRDTIVREDLLTDQDIEKMLAVCSTNMRDRAFIDCHYEAGTRAGEILNLRIRHVKFDKYGAILHVDGKTGGRTIRLVRSVANLAKWLDVHPYKNNPDAPLWVLFDIRYYGNPLTYTTACKIIRDKCKLAGVNKHVNLHLFRHSAATNAAKFMTEAQLRKRHGWTPDSNMTSRYVHLVNADVDDAIFEHYGIKTQQAPEPAKLPKTCQICQMPNSHDANTCSRCLKPLDLQAATLLEEKALNENNELKQEIEKMRIEIDQLKYGPEAREAKLAKALFQFKDDKKTQNLLTFVQLVIEMLPEEKKRMLLKKQIRLF